MWTKSYLLIWLIAFALTQITEVPIYRKILGASISEAFGASAITHPLLWFLYVPLLDGRIAYVLLIVIGEVAITLIEAGYFAFLFKRKRALLASVVANGASIVVGLVTDAIFHWSSIELQ